jgi:hypothetical protein
MCLAVPSFLLAQGCTEDVSFRVASKFHARARVETGQYLEGRFAGAANLFN